MQKIVLFATIFLEKQNIFWQCQRVLSMTVNSKPFLSFLCPSLWLLYFFLLLLVFSIPLFISLHPSAVSLCVCACVGQRRSSPCDAGRGSSCAPAPPSCPLTPCLSLRLTLATHPSPPPHTQTLLCSERVCPSMRTFCSWQSLVLKDCSRLK